MLKKLNWKYAIGEVLIVIIGISVAFSLNNWNENRIRNGLKIQYLENLRSDMKAEIEQLQANILDMEHKSTISKKLLQKIGTDSPGKDSLGSYVFELARLTTFVKGIESNQNLIDKIGSELRY